MSPLVWSVSQFAQRLLLLRVSSFHASSRIPSNSTTNDIRVGRWAGSCISAAFIHLIRPASTAWLIEPHLILSRPFIMNARQYASLTSLLGCVCVRSSGATHDNIFKLILMGKTRSVPIGFMRPRSIMVATMLSTSSDTQTLSYFKSLWAKSS